MSNVKHPAETLWRRCLILKHDNMKRKGLSTLTVAVLIMACSCTNEHEPALDMNAKRYYNTDIKQLFGKAGCTACHDGTYSGGVSILVNSESYTDVLKTWVDTTVDSKQTILYKALNPTATTDPKINMRINPAVTITQSEVEIINLWLKAGAPEKP